MGVEKDDYRRFHEACGSGRKDDVAPARTERPTASLDEFERRQELYGLFKHVAAPGIVRKVLDFRARFRLGLVRPAAGGVESSIDADFSREAAEARAGGDLAIANVVHRAMRGTLETAACAWRDDMLAVRDADYARMEELVAPGMRQKYGEHPVPKRIASATAQTVSVGLGMQELAKRLYRKKFGREAAPGEVLQSHRSGLRVAMAWADFNQHQLVSLEAKIRTLRDTHDEIEPLHAEHAFDVAEDGTLTFVGAGELAAVTAEKPNVRDGRFGCPGKRHIPTLWQWTEEVSSEYGLTAEG